MLVLLVLIKKLEVILSPPVVMLEIHAMTRFRKRSGVKI